MRADLKVGHWVVQMVDLTVVQLELSLVAHLVDYLVEKMARNLVVMSEQKKVH